MYVLSWNDKKLEVSGNKKYTYGSWSAQSAYKTEEVANGAAMPKSKAVSPDQGKLSFEIKMSLLMGINVEAEYKWWRNECNKGTESILYLGDSEGTVNTQYGDYKWRLVGVSQSELIVLPEGKWKSCTVTLTFEESAYKVKQTKLEKKALKLAKKAEKLAAKALKAKNEKAREKYAQKAAAAQKKAEEAQAAALKEYSDNKKLEKENRLKTEALIQKYYDQP